MVATDLPYSWPTADSRVPKMPTATSIEAPSRAVSIVMPVLDNLEWTRKGIESIKANTTVPHELILIDNGSGPETAAFLRDMADVLIRNEENRGCAGAWNQGVQASRHPFVCIVNNDIEVPCGWMERLIDFLEAFNYAIVSPSVREGPFDYDLDSYNRKFAELLSNRHFRSEMRGIAMLSRRDLYDRVGGFDESFRFGKYEDEDMYFRIREAGMDVATTSAVLLHHYGSKTVNLVKERSSFDYELANRRYFMKKWRRRLLWRRWRKFQMKWRHRSIHRRFGVEY